MKLYGNVWGHYCMISGHRFEPLRATSQTPRGDNRSDRHRSVPKSSTQRTNVPHLPGSDEEHADNQGGKTIYMYICCSHCRTGPANHLPGEWKIANVIYDVTFFYRFSHPVSAQILSGVHHNGSKKRVSRHQPCHFRESCLFLHMHTCSIANMML